MTNGSLKTALQSVIHLSLCHSVFRFRLSPKETLPTATSSSSMVVKATAWSTTLDQTKHLSNLCTGRFYAQIQVFFLSVFHQIIYISSCSTSHEMHLLYLLPLSFNPFSQRIKNSLEKIGIFFFF